ncbi:MAG: shikimate dehydrogenase [Buchnera aphidicola (Brevicoryne brassicae)]|uniref:Shikimate dehydrogenase (NADP(+)) n=1 Tax=Buchnera aphidicola (Brevicoryne brassicae) TaxID=911343 RepID=A0AAJ5TXI6_9GAMM|nr:shikimate dehydrogenase [Buchnera aphidicola]QCI20036.1 shikimate dehydrogenase [Buchnera aphidicola (Brevicoryne brassicae)]WAI18860.1 MAG: shikimate dehydrogenase [Buchnera aphidicola (Brevicoryne brassicae)]
MFKNQNFNYAVFGNPINHSKSPEIHGFFSNQTNVFHTYESVNVPLDEFVSFLLKFFKKHGKGANITAPFKQEAYLFCDKLTERARIAQSVNTLKKVNNKYILGDNTDGIGLLSDLIRLNFIKKNNSILILGAGGAVRGILFPLLSFGCSVFILNRTLSNAEKLVVQFSKYGKINIFDKNSSEKKHFDLIINATSKYDKNNENNIDVSFVSSKTCFYDMNYHKYDTPFFSSYIKKRSNGIGMLVFQAAHSFFLWHNIFPETNYIINSLKRNMK